MKEGGVKVAQSRIRDQEGRESVHTGVLPGVVSEPEQGDLQQGDRPRAGKEVSLPRSSMTWGFKARVGLWNAGNIL